MTGAGGQLGTDLVSVLPATGDEVVGLDPRDLDITDPNAAVRRAVDEVWPDVVRQLRRLHRASTPPRPTRRRATRSTPPARACSPWRRPATAPAAAVSTDYVFDGDADRAVRRGRRRPAPRSAYGRTKLAGERAVLGRAAGRLRRADGVGLRRRRPRTSSGRWPGSRRNARPSSVVDDQHGSPTWSRDLASRLATLGVAGASRHLALHR